VTAAVHDGDTITGVWPGLHDRAYGIAFDVGSTTVAGHLCDLASGDFHELPTDFTYVLHLATFRNGGLDYDEAMRVNAEGTHLLLEHCRAAKAALIMSTAEDYKPQPKPMHAYPDTDRLLITADSGGANGSRRRTWKTELVTLAAETGLAISVCHLPPGTSKWNKIEHRLFSQITLNWRGRPLTSHHQQCFWMFFNQNFRHFK